MLLEGLESVDNALLVKLQEVFLTVLSGHDVFGSVLKFIVRNCNLWSDFFLEISSRMTFRCIIIHKIT